jgi:hypothetical protein
MATGKHAIGLCQRCSFVYKLSVLRADGETNLLVCDACWDESHPSKRPIRTKDDTTLRRPAPDLDAVNSRVIDDDRPIGEVLGCTYYFGEQP